MSLNVRHLQLEDCKIIERAFQAQGWVKPEWQYLQYLKEQSNGKRLVLLAEYEEEFAGYLTVQWKSNYPPFKKAKIPEIVDLNVLKKFQHRGIASVLIDIAEERIEERSNLVGIGFGVTYDYGPAQALYVKRGYIPDARGLWKDGKQVEPGETIRVDDGVVMYLLKEL